MDGLRGWASLVVVLCHTLQVWMINPALMQARGLAPVLDAINRTPLGAAIDGQMAVYVFFAISGMALGYSIISAERPKERLISLALFRYFRLTVPILASCVIAYLVLIAGGFHNVEAAAASQSAWLDSFYRFEPNLTDMLRFALLDVYFAYDGATSWNAVLWTMPIELVWSFGLFALFVIPWRVPRMITAAALAAYFYNNAAFGFFAGYLLAEFMLTAAAKRSTPRDLVGLAFIIVGVAIATLRNWPNTNAFVDFLQSVAGRNLIAILVLTGVTLSHNAQAVLSDAASRFMGRISFSLYLVHLIIICSLSSALFLIVREYVPFGGQIAIVLMATVVSSLIAARAFAWAFEEKTLGALKAIFAAISARVRDRAADRQLSPQQD